jgi:DNA processing protein
VRVAKPRECAKFSTKSGANRSTGTSAAGRFDASSEQLATTLIARIIWSAIAEPGDACAGALTQFVTPSEALCAVLEQQSAQSMLRRLCEIHEKTADPLHSHAETSERRAAGLPDELKPRSLSAAVRRWMPRMLSLNLDSLIRTAVRHDMELVSPENPLWPQQLNDLGAHTAQMLWCSGETSLLRQRSIAIVGARAMTHYGERVTSELALAASQSGATIVSGAAYGVDAVAHRVALQQNTPTVAVLAGGLDRPYPAAHKNLITAVANTGLVCSEVCPGTAPTRWRFLQRNRIIAALAAATLVTEAGARSGSINTAGHAAEIGRPVGAVPGQITSPASVGCHRLIREYGAELITNAHDVRALMGGWCSAPEEETGESRLRACSTPDRPPSLHVRVLDALPVRGSRTVASVAQLSGLGESEVRQTLAELELLGNACRVDSGPASQWKLVRKRPAAP